MSTDKGPLPEAVREQAHQIAVEIARMVDDDEETRIYFERTLCGLAEAAAQQERARIRAHVETRCDLSAHAKAAFRARGDNATAGYHDTIIGVCDGILENIGPVASHPPPTPEEP